MFVANLGKAVGKLEQPFRLTNDYWTSTPDCWTADSETMFYTVRRNEHGQIRGSIYKPSFPRILRRYSLMVGELRGLDSQSGWRMANRNS